MSIWAEGNTYCHSCGVSAPAGTFKDTLYTVDTVETNGNLLIHKDNNPLLPTGYTKEFFGVRGLSVQGLKKYDTHVFTNPEGEPEFMSFPYGNGRFKRRTLDPNNKDFRWYGEGKEFPLFGMNKFEKGSSRHITLFEGECDAIAGWQMLGSPCVSVKSSSSAPKDCTAARDYLNSFDKIYICFDSDEVGQRAVAKVARLFNPGKVYHVKLGTAYKDANDFLKAGKKQEFKTLWTNTKLFLPEGIVGGYDQVEAILKSEGQATIGSYPFEQLEGTSLGIRSSEVVLLTAQEGIGKTEIVRAIEYHLLKTTDYNMGIIHLEEKEKRSVQGLIGYELRAPVHLGDTGHTVNDQLNTYKKICRKDGRLFFYPHFGSDNPDVILDIIRYLATACECKFIFLDHITMVVSGFETDDERKKLDYLSTRLAMLVKELDFTLFLVSHVNDLGQTRGSRNIGKICDLRIDLDRPIKAASDKERNTTTVTVSKNRYGAKTGPSGRLLFDAETFVLRDTTVEEDATEECPF